MGRYTCQKGKITGIAKANRVCLIKRCPYLLVSMARRGKKAYRRVMPVGLLDNYLGC
jgi:hypothetical protein